MEQLLARLWYPALMALSLLAFLALLEGGYSALTAAYLPVIGAGIAIVLLEIVFPENPEWRPQWSDLRADAAFMAIVQVLLPRLLAAGLVILVAAWTSARFASSLWPHDWPLLAQLLVMVLIVDFLRYWLHRACHRYMPLWRLHEVHHSPDILYVLNVGRFHPFEKALHFLCDTAAFVLLGVGPEVLAGYFLLYSVNGFFQHSNVKLRYGWLNYVVGSAETHRWHHARDLRMAACNFGNTTIVWDLLFGTWALPGRMGATAIGIPDRGYPRGFLAQLAQPFHSRDA